jgi:hypothetical protein
LITLTDIIGDFYYFAAADRSSPLFEPENTFLEVKRLFGHRDV